MRRQDQLHEVQARHGGTQGVGRATTNAVVASAVAVIAVDFFVTRLLITVLY